MNADTAALLPYAALADEIEQLLHDDHVQVPPRSVQPLPGGGSLLLMPALDARLAITKLITYVPANAGTGRPAIQGDVAVFDIATGARRLLLDGPTVTARRTAAVSLVAARKLAARPDGPLLVVGAGVQGRAHLEAFTQGLRVREAWIASRSEASAQALAAYAETLGIRARVTGSPDTVLPHCPLVVTCTPAQQVVLDALPRDDTFIAAVGAFTPQMVELSARLCQHIAQHGRMLVDTRDADHEAGDLLQAGIDVAACPTLGTAVRSGMTSRPGPVLFKSCGWAGWDLAAARLAVPPHP